MGLPGKFREKSVDFGVAEYNICIVLGCKNKRQVKGGRQNFNAAHGQQRRYQMCEPHRDEKNKQGVVHKLKTAQ